MRRGPRRGPRRPSDGVARGGCRGERAHAGAVGGAGAKEWGQGGEGRPLEGSGHLNVLGFDSGCRCFSVTNCRQRESVDRHRPQVRLPPPKPHPARPPRPPQLPQPPTTTPAKTPPTSPSDLEHQEEGVSGGGWGRGFRPRRRAPGGGGGGGEAARGLPPRPLFCGRTLLPRAGDLFRPDSVQPEGPVAFLKVP